MGDVVKHGCLLDGFPRTGVQAADLAKYVQVDRFILFDVPDETVVSRALGRLNDPVTGDIYHLSFAPPPPELVARLVRRQNDVSESVVHKRLKVYHEQLALILPHFQDKLFVVNGVKPIAEVAKSVVENLTRPLLTRIDPSDDKAYTLDGVRYTHKSSAFDDMTRYWE